MERSVDVYVSRCISPICSLLILRVAVSGLTINACCCSLQFTPSLAVEASVMKHRQYRINQRFSNFFDHGTQFPGNEKILSINSSLNSSSSFASFKRNLKTYYFLMPSLRSSNRLYSPYFSPSDCPRLEFGPPARYNLLYCFKK